MGNDPKMYVIETNDPAKGRWWRAGGAGYTNRVAEAGLFTEADFNAKHISHRGDTLRDAIVTLAEEFQRLQADSTAVSRRAAELFGNRDVVVPALIMGLVTQADAEALQAALTYLEARFPRGTGRTLGLESPMREAAMAVSPIEGLLARVKVALRGA